MQAGVESGISVKLSSVSRALESGQFHLYILLSRRILPGCVCVTLFTTVCSAFHTHTHICKSTSRYISISRYMDLYVEFILLFVMNWAFLPNGMLVRLHVILHPFFSF